MQLESKAMVFDACSHLHLLCLCIHLTNIQGAVKISPLDGSPPNERSAFSDFPSPQPVEVVVRVYIVEVSCFVFRC